MEEGLLEIYLRGFKFSYTLWRYWMTKEPGNFGLDLGNGKHEVSLLSELPKSIVRRSDHTFPTLMKLIDSNVLPAVNAKWAEDETNRLRNNLIEEIGNGVLLFPAHPTPAHPHYTPFFRPYNFAYWAIFNVLHLPVTAVPMGLSKSGLPIGIQVVSAPYNDHLCIAVAKELERAFIGYEPPCPVGQ